MGGKSWLGALASEAPALAAVLILSAASMPAEDTASEERLITAEGIASVEGNDVPAARERATDDALRRAVEQAVGTLMESEAIVQNRQVLTDSVYAQSRGFVRGYEIISEKREGPLYRVGVAAAVAVGDLRDNLESLGLLMRMRKARVMVMIPEQNILELDLWWRWSASIGTVETAVIRALTANEFTVVDSAEVRRGIDKETALKAIEGDLAAVRAVAVQAEAEILITGQATVEPGGTVAGTQMRSYQASVSARAVKADTGEIIGASTGSGMTVHLNAAAGGTDALEQAAAGLANDLISQVAARWAEETSGARVIGISVAGVSRDLVDEFIAKMSTAVRGVVEVYEREFAGTVARLDVEFRGAGGMLAQAVDGLALAGGRLEVTATTPNRIDVRFVREGS